MMKNNHQDIASAKTMSLEEKRHKQALHQLDKQKNAQLASSRNKSLLGKKGGADGGKKFDPLEFYHRKEAEKKIKENKIQEAILLAKERGEKFDPDTMKTTVGPTGRFSVERENPFLSPTPNHKLQPCANIQAKPTDRTFPPYVGRRDSSFLWKMATDGIKQKDEFQDDMETVSDIALMSKKAVHIDPLPQHFQWMHHRNSLQQEFVELTQENKEYLRERGSFGSKHDVFKPHKKMSIGVNEDPEVERFMQNIQKQYDASGNTDVNMAALQHYYKSLCDEEDTETINNKKIYGRSQVTIDREKKKIARRKMLALEAMMQQMPTTNQTAPAIEPEDLLACRYLRLGKDNVEELEEQVWGKGLDPGIHAHMTQAQVEEHFELKKNTVRRKSKIAPTKPN